MRSACLLVALAGCFWKPDPGPAPLMLAAGPAAVLSRVAPKGAHLEGAVRAGSACDPVGQEGLAWLVAHGVAEGGSAARRPEEVAALLKSWDGVLTVSVDPEIARFTLDVAPEHAVDAAELLGELLTKPALDPVVLHRLSSQADARLREGLPGEGAVLASQLLVNWIFQGHPYGHPAVGRWGVVSNLRPEDARHFFEERYVRPALVGGAAMAAPADPLGRLQGGLNAAPPRLSRSPLPRPVQPASGRKVLVVGGPTGGAWIAVGLRVPLLAQDPDRPALQLAAEVLRARVQTRVEGPLWVETEPFSQAAQGDFALTLQTAADQGPSALRAALDALGLLALQGVSAAELEVAREALLARRASAVGDPDLALASAMRAAALSIPDPLDTLPKALGDLDVAAVNAALGRQLHPQDLRVVAVVADPDQFSHALREEKAPPPVQEASVAGAVAAGATPPAGYVLGIDEVVISSAQDLLR